MKTKLYWVVDGDFRVGPCDEASVCKWYGFIVDRGGVPRAEVYEVAE